ncbi:MAG: hypothetical protein U1E25_14690 [Methylocystis sp.]
MSITQDPAGAPLFVEYRPGTRRRIAAAVDALVALLDEIDGDPDLEEDDPLEDVEPLEDGGDDEPSLGAPGAAFLPSQSHWSQGAGDDLEDEHDGREPGDDDEPSLGSLNSVDQTLWARSDDSELEYDPAEVSGCGDMDGVMEQHGFGVEYAE